MILNRFIIALAFALLLLNGCQKSNQFKVSGTITHAEGDTIYLDELLISATKPVDQTTIDSKGRFELTGEASMPTFHVLRLANQNIILLLDSTENVVIEADVVNFSREYLVEGSYGSQQVRILSQKLASTEQKLDSLVTRMEMNRGTEAFEWLKKERNEEYIRLIDEQAEFSKKFILDNPFSMASVYALYQKYRIGGSPVMNDFQTKRTAASALNAVYPNSDFVKALYEDATQLYRQQRADELRQLIAEQGKNSPDIVLPNIDGEKVALSSLIGKIVLLQFWAAEDQNSRIMNQPLAEAYQKYKSKGFEIYQVNIGQNRSEWIDAIDTDKMSWINVGDLEGSVNAVNSYNINSIPSNYLLDQEGVIRAKNLSGTNLDKALAQLLN